MSESPEFMRVELRAAKRESERLQNVAIQQGELVASLSKQLTDAQMVRMLVNVEHANEDVRIARAVEAEREALSEIVDKQYYAESIWQVRKALAIVRAAIRSRTEHAGVAQAQEERRSSDREPGRDRDAGSTPAPGTTQAPDSGKPEAVSNLKTGNWRCGLCGLNGNVDEFVEHLARCYSRQAPPLTEARVRTLIAEYVAEWTQQDLAWMHTTDARLSALESQQETARGEKTDKAGDVGPADDGLASQVRQSEPSAATPSPAPPSPPPMTDEDLGEALLVVLRHDQSEFDGGTAMAREARRLLGPELEIALELLKSERSANAGFREAFRAEYDRARNEKARADAIEADRDRLRDDEVELDTRLKSARARVAELEARKPYLAIEAAARETMQWFIAPGRLDGGTYRACEEILSRHFTAARSARLVTAHDIATLNGLTEADKGKSWNQTKADHLNDLLSSRGDDKPQGVKLPIIRRLIGGGDYVELDELKASLRSQGFTIEGE